MNWFKKLFHKHTPVWESRKVAGKTTIDYTTHGIIDIEPATIYIRNGYCFECGEKLRSRYTIANIFDEPQPYDDDKLKKKEK